MLYQVYHAKNPTFGMGQPPSYPSDYERVAEVDCEDLEDVFRVTNHIDSDWTANEEVKWRKTDGRGTRSTSVGDIVVDPQGNIHRCANAGWELIGHS